MKPQLNLVRGHVISVCDKHSNIAPFYALLKNIADQVRAGKISKNDIQVGINITPLAINTQEIAQEVTSHQIPTVFDLDEVEDLINEELQNVEHEEVAITNVKTSMLLHLLDLIGVEPFSFHSQELHKEISDVYTKLQQNFSENSTDHDLRESLFQAAFDNYKQRSAKYAIDTVIEELNLYPNKVTILFSPDDVDMAYIGVQLDAALKNRKEMKIRSTILSLNDFALSEEESKVEHDNFFEKLTKMLHVDVPAGVADLFHPLFAREVLDANGVPVSEFLPASDSEVRALLVPVAA